MKVDPNPMQSVVLISSSSIRCRVMLVIMFGLVCISLLV
jgi:hypothetical protein